MLRTTSVTICNRLSSAAAVLLPNDQGLCAARPAGVPPRRRGALSHPIGIIRARPESGFAKDDLHFRMQIELRRDFYTIAAGHGRRFPQRNAKNIFTHDQCECSHLKDFEARLLGRRFPKRNGTSTVWRRSAGQSKKASQRLRSGSARVGDERPVRIFMLVPTQIPTARTGSMMAFGQRRMISPIWMVQERPWFLSTMIILLSC